MFKMTPKSRGQLSLTCRAYNIKFPELTISRSQDFTVQAAPRPVISFSPDVRVNDGYILAGSTATVLCSLVDRGFPPTEAVWVHSDGQTLASESKDGVARLSIQHNANGTPQTLKCQGKATPDTNDESSLSFTPKFAYGPTEVSMVTTDNKNETVDHCLPNETVTVSCLLRSDSYSPDVTVTLEGDGTTSRTADRVLTVNGTERHMFKMTPKSRGQLSLTCRAYNRKFPELTISRSQDFSVQALPKPVITFDPNMKMNDGFILTGRTATVLCSLVDRGFPPTEAEWVSSNGQTLASEEADGIARLFVEYNKSDPTPTFECRAKGNPGNTTEKLFQPKFAYGPSDVSISVRDGYGDEVSHSPQNETLNVTCLIEEESFSPSVVASLEVNGERIVNSSNANTMDGYSRFVFELTTWTRSPLIITCRISNSKFSDIIATRSTMITVNGPIPRQGSSRQMVTPLLSKTHWSVLSVACGLLGLIAGTAIGVFSQRRRTESSSQKEGPKLVRNELSIMSVSGNSLNGNSISRETSLEDDYDSTYNVLSTDYSSPTSPSDSVSDTVGWNWPTKLGYAPTFENNIYSA